MPLIQPFRLNRGQIYNKDDLLSVRRCDLTNQAVITELLVAGKTYTSALFRKTQ